MGTRSERRGLPREHFYLSSKSGAPATKSLLVPNPRNTFKHAKRHLSSFPHTLAKRASTPAPCPDFWDLGTRSDSVAFLQVEDRMGSGLIDMSLRQYIAGYKRKEWYIVQVLRC